MPRKRGPAPTAGTADQKSTISVRISPALKDKLVAAMQAHDRSLSQEAEIRLEGSFWTEGLLDQVLDLAYGRSLAGLLLLLGRTMNEVGRHAGFAEKRSLEGADEWADSPFAYEQVVQAVIEALRALRPKGSEAPPSDTDPEIGRLMARGHLEALQRGKDRRGDVPDWPAAIRERVPALLERMTFDDSRIALGTRGLGPDYRSTAVLSKAATKGKR